MEVVAHENSEASSESSIVDELDDDNVPVHGNILVACES